MVFSYILHPAEHNERRITKVDKDFTEKIDFKDMKFPVKYRDIHKIEKKVLSPLLFLDIKQGKISNIYIKEEKHVDLLLIGEERKRHYVLIKDYSTFRYDHTLHGERKIFLLLWLTSFQ